MIFRKFQKASQALSAVLSFVVFLQTVNVQLAQAGDLTPPPDTTVTGTIDNTSINTTTTSLEANASSIDEYTYCLKQSTVCVDSVNPKYMTNDYGDEIELAYNPCWEYVSTYNCFTAEDHDSCRDAGVDMNNWTYRYTDNRRWPNDDQSLMPFSWDDHYSSNELLCDGDTSFGCGDPFYVENDVVSLIQDDGSTVDVQGGVIEYKRCYDGEKPYCNTNENCSIAEATCVSTLDNLCVREEQTYRCSPEDGACVSMDNVPTSAWPEGDNGFGNAASSLSFATMLARDAEPDASGNIRIFSGTGHTCYQIEDEFLDYLSVVSIILTIFSFGVWAAVVGYGASILSSYTCCEPHVDDVSPGLMYQLCDEEDMKLAAARMANRAHHVGGPTDTGMCHCTTSVPLWDGAVPAPPEHLFDCAAYCLGYQIRIDWRDTWCHFGSMLARIIQEQGREQLIDLAVAGAADATSDNYSFNYYGDENKWLDPITVNGNTVRFWQWDRACQDPESRYEAATTASLVCPDLPRTYIAACSKDPSECLDLPTDPRYGAGASWWSVSPIPIDDEVPTAISKFVVASGLCNDTSGACAYDLHAWPAGAGGQLHQTYDMEWPLVYVATGYNDFSWEHGIYQVEGYTYDINNPPAVMTPKIRWRKQLAAGGYSDWVELNVDNPLGDVNWVLDNGPPKATLFGGCTDTTCTYRMMVESTVTAKPWGYLTQDHTSLCIGGEVAGTCIGFKHNTDTNKEWHPQCEGFTMEEIQVLDFEAMDFSEYIASLDMSATLAQTNEASPEEMQGTAAADAAAIEANGPSSNAPAMVSGQQTFEIKPSSTSYSIPILLTAAGTVYPVTDANGLSNYSINKVTVNWGDGVVESKVPTASSVPFEHSYADPGASTTYVVTITFETTGGVFDDHANVLIFTDAPVGDAEAYTGPTDQGDGTYDQNTLPGGRSLDTYPY